MIVGICDDDKIDRNIEIELCTQIKQEKGIEFDIIQYENGIKFLEDKKVVDILILDIEMSKVNGIQIKNYLQNINSKTLIIFITSHDDMMESAFGINVYAFVKKIYLKTQFKEIVYRAINMLIDYVIVDNNINSRKIIYIKAEHIYSNINLNGGDNKILRCSITKLQKRLENVDFIRIHRSYLVNPEYIKLISNSEVLLKNGEKIPIALRRLKKVKNKYLLYCEKKARYC